MRGRRNKTDKADVRLIAASTRDESPPAWSPPSPDVRELQALVRRRDDLRQLAAHEKARLDAPLLTPAARRSVARVVKLLSKEANAMQAAADALIAITPGLTANRDLLATIYHPGGWHPNGLDGPGRTPGPPAGGQRPGRSSLLRAVPARVQERLERPRSDPAVQVGQRPAAEDAGPADPHGRPVQPHPQGVLPSPRGRR
jgi:hypothetical protein